MRGRSFHLGRLHSCSDSSGKAYAARGDGLCDAGGQVGVEDLPGQVSGRGGHSEEEPRILIDLRRLTVPAVVVQAADVDSRARLEGVGWTEEACSESCRRRLREPRLLLSLALKVEVPVHRQQEAAQEQTPQEIDQRLTVHEVHWLVVLGAQRYTERLHAGHRHRRI